MILAAGRGERMRPLTDTTPKPLLRVAGKPLIVWHIERLVAAGIRDIIINHAWLGEKIESTLGNGDQFGARLCYSPEPIALETAGGIARALPFFQDQPFLVVNGDIWCDWNPALVNACVQALRDRSAVAWLLMVNNPDHNPKGDFLLGMPSEPARPGADDPFESASDKPHVQTLLQEHLSFSPVRLRNDGDDENLYFKHTQALTFAGISLYQPCFFLDVAPDVPAALAPLLRTAIKADRVIGTPYTGRWVDVGTPARLHMLDQRLAMQGQARYTSTDF